jgi:hypothetical protein
VNPHAAQMMAAVKAAIGKTLPLEAFGKITRSAVIPVPEKVMAGMASSCVLLFVSCIVAL